MHKFNIYKIIPVATLSIIATVMSTIYVDATLNAGDLGTAHPGNNYAICGSNSGLRIENATENYNASTGTYSISGNYRNNRSGTITGVAEVWACRCAEGNGNNSAGHCNANWPANNGTTGSGMSAYQAIQYCQRLSNINLNVASNGTQNFNATISQAYGQDCGSYQIEIISRYPNSSGQQQGEATSTSLNFPNSGYACVWQDWYQIVGLYHTGKTCSTQPTARCGNNTCDANETCDGALRCSGGGIFSSSSCRAANTTYQCTYCGDGVTQSGAGEQCDDGNTNDSDSCTNSCMNRYTTMTFCGDGVQQWPNSNGQYEQCDDGNTNNNDTCNNSCRYNYNNAYCGNGILESGEECDDGNNINTDSCNNLCRRPYVNPVCPCPTYNCCNQCNTTNYCGSCSSNNCCGNSCSGGTINNTNSDNNVNIIGNSNSVNVYGYSSGYGYGYNYSYTNPGYYSYNPGYYSYNPVNYTNNPTAQIYYY